MFNRARALVPLSVLLLPVLLAAQAKKSRPAPSAPVGVPSRPLLGEMGKAALGSAATVHTIVGSGPGMVLASSQEVLASLHLVLNGKGQMTPHIAVDISTPPQKPLTNIAASVVAQDPGDGLVLLKLDHPIPAPAAAPASIPVPLHAAPAHAVASAAAESRPYRRPADPPVRPALVAQSEVPVSVALSADSEHSFYVAGHPAAARRHRRPVRQRGRSTHKRHTGVKVVYDGP